MKDVVVIGAGIIGATVAEVLRKKGRDVLLLSDEQPMMGTRPSGGHLKPSWFSGMKKEAYEPAMQLLDDIWGLSKEPFLVKHTGLHTDVYRVNTDVVMKARKTLAKVRSILNWQTPILTYERLDTGEAGQLECKLLVIAAGVWSDYLLPKTYKVHTEWKQGVSFRVQGKLQEPFINPWAPYKQIVAHQQSSNEIWIGDGTAIKSENWDDERTETCRQRCLNQLKNPGVTQAYLGFRPYCEPMEAGDPCYFRWITKSVCVATGAGKSGTISAGWVARRILDAC